MQIWIKKYLLLFWTYYVLGWSALVEKFFVWSAGMVGDGVGQNTCSLATDTLLSPGRDSASTDWLAGLAQARPDPSLLAASTAQSSGDLYDSTITTL